MTPDVSTESWARLRAHLHRGGTAGYWWTAENKRSYWWRGNLPAPIPQGKGDIFFGVHPTAKAKHAHERAKLSEIVAINCVFAEFDAKDFGGDKAAILVHIKSLALQPSVIVDSGGGYHGYWLLADPFVIQSDADRERAKQAQSDWVESVGGDLGAKDLARVLRVPGTQNYKYTPSRPVEIIEADFERLYKLNELEAGVVRAAALAPVKPRAFGQGYTRYVATAVESELGKLARAKEGARNAQLNKSAFALGQLVGAGMLDRAEIESNLANVARAIALTDRETLATIRSGVQAGMRKPRVIPSKGNGHEPRSSVDMDDAPSISAQSGRYTVRDGRICRWKQTRDGAVIVPLCNFSAQIVEEVAHDDGADVTRLLAIEGKRADGTPLPPARVDATQFAGMRWVSLNWGTHAIVEAGQSAQDHLRAAIQHLSANVTTRHVFTHTGWRTVGGKRVFLTQAGAIGDTGVTVELDKELERYHLPTQPVNVCDAMQASLRFLNIAPKRVTVPLWAAMYLAPLAPILAPHFMLWVYGATGTLKSTLSALALSHYGDFTQDDLITWLATANALEKYLFLAKDVPFVIDDFAPQSDQMAARKLEDTAGQLVRGVGNRSGRARMRSDLSLRAVYRPRGLAIATGEQIPDGQSLVARLATVEVSKGEVDLPKLSEAQDERGRYRDAMSGYVGWLAKQWEHLEATLPALWRDARTRARREGQHLRVPESLASLYVGADLGLSYAVEVGTISEADAAQLRGECWQALVGIAESQSRQVEEQRPTRRFVTILTELITQGKARLNSLATPNENGDSELLGWFDDNYLYLLPSGSYHRIAQYSREEGKHFGIKEAALRKSLNEEGLLVADDTHLTARVRVGGSQKRVLKLVRSEVEKISGLSLEKVVTVVTDRP